MAEPDRQQLSSSPSHYSTLSKRQFNKNLKKQLKNINIYEKEKGEGAMTSGSSSSSCCCRPADAVTKSMDKKMDFALLTIKLPLRVGVVPRGASFTSTRRPLCGVRVRASVVDSNESSSNFVKRMEQAWLISQQPRPVSCSSCNSNGHIDCKWCAGTGFFILGDNMLCQVPSRNTTCVICAGKGSMCCSDCKGTGFRAKWLGEPPISK